MSEVIDGDWLSMEPVRVGGVPAAFGTPACYVTVVEYDKPILRVDVYPYPPDCYPFQEAIVWRGNLIVGFGSYVHAISMADRSTVTIVLDSYFGHLYPTRDYLLLASGEGLFRMEPDRSILWRMRISASTASSCTRRVRQLFEAKASGSSRRLATLRGDGRRWESGFLKRVLPNRPLQRTDGSVATLSLPSAAERQYRWADKTHGAEDRKDPPQQATSCFFDSCRDGELLAGVCPCPSGGASIMLPMNPTSPIATVSATSPCTTSWSAGSDWVLVMRQSAGACEVRFQAADGTTYASSVQFDALGGCCPYTYSGTATPAEPVDAGTRG